MNVHKNARLTVAGRGLLVERVSGGWTVQRAAAAAGISRRTAHKWLDRYRRGGTAALADRSSAPRRCPHRMPAERLAQIEQLRRQRLSGPRIARALQLARSSVGLVLRRLGLGRLASLDERPAVIRYERQRPGEMLHLDIKSLGRIARPGHRVTGNRRDRVEGIGWEHLHVAIDDASRLAYTEVLPGLGREDATGFLIRALAWFNRLGIGVERVMTDNGSAYRSKLFATALDDAGIRHVRTRPYTPRTNGKAERFIQSSLREWAYARSYASGRTKPAHRPMDRRLQPNQTPCRHRRHHTMAKSEQPTWKRQLGHPDHTVVEGSSTVGNVAGRVET